MRRIDLNCDLGEGEPPAHTRALMRWVTSVNVACGGHAGDAASMERCLALAASAGVRVGAHPGLSGSFGRAEAAPGIGELQLLLLQQVGALQTLARRRRMRLHHVKLHGALYHAVERIPGLADAYLAAMRRWFPGVKVYARADGVVAGRASRWEVPVWAEGFADRAYRDDGQLVPRTESGALLTERAAIRDRLRRWRRGQAIQANSGAWLSLRPDTICVHGDTPGAVALARLAARELGWTQG